MLMPKHSQVIFFLSFVPLQALVVRTPHIRYNKNNKYIYSESYFIQQYILIIINLLATKIVWTKDTYIRKLLSSFKQLCSANMINLWWGFRDTFSLLYFDQRYFVVYRAKVLHCHFCCSMSKAHVFLGSIRIPKFDYSLGNKHDYAIVANYQSNTNIGNAHTTYYGTTEQWITLCWYCHSRCSHNNHPQFVQIIVFALPWIVFVVVFFHPAVGHWRQRHQQPQPPAVVHQVVPLLYMAWWWCCGISMRRRRWQRIVAVDAAAPPSSLVDCCLHCCLIPLLLLYSAIVVFI